MEISTFEQAIEAMREARKDAEKYRKSRDRYRSKVIEYGEREMPAEILELMPDDPEERALAIIKYRDSLTKHD